MPNTVTESGSEIIQTNYGGLPSTHMDRANGTEGSPTAVLANDPVGAWGCRPHNGSDFAEHSTAAIYMRAGQNQTPSAQGTWIEFWVTPNGTTWESRLKAMTIQGSVVKFHLPVEFSTVSGPVDMDTYESFSAGAMTGWSSTTRDERLFKQNGLDVKFVINVSGTSNSSTVSMQMPVLPRQSGVYKFEGQCGLCTNNGSAGGGRWSIDADTGVLTIWVGTAGAWTASGTKEVRLEGFYEAEPEEE